MSGHVKIRDLELIIALQEEGNLTQAAKRIGISEPGISKRLRLIERRIHAHLFDRNHGGASITDEGRSFVQSARVSVQAFHQAVYEAHETKRGERPKLRIGASVFLAPHLIEIMHAVELRLYRDLVIQVFSAYSCELLNQLEHRQLDIALVISPPPMATISSVCFARSPFMIVSREGHPFASRECVSISDIAKHPWVFFHRSVHPPLHDQILQRMETAKRTPNIVHRVSHADHVPPLLTDNDILAWLTPTGAARVASQGFNRVPLVDETISLETHIATLASNKSGLVSEFVRSFMTQIERQRKPIQLALPIQ